VKKESPDVSRMPASSNNKKKNSNSNRMPVATKNKTKAPAPRSANEITQDQHRELVEFLTTNDHMREVARNALKQGLWAGGGAIVGGIFLGPLGGLAGGILGSVLGYKFTDEYDGMVQQLGDLSADHRGRLVEAVGKVLEEAGGVSTTILLPGAFLKALQDTAGNSRLRNKIWAACVDIMKDDGAAHEASLTS
jgi:hypothetical protein